MPKWFERLKGQADRPARQMAASLSHYPPYEAPHPGPPARWTLPQARENLDHLLLQREHRLAVLGDWLRPLGIDTRPALAGGDPAPLLQSLHHWVNDCWPSLHDPAIASLDVWLRSERRDGEIVYSLLMDLAILLGELILRRHPGYRWELDLDEENGRVGMRSYRRPVLLLRAHGSMPADIELDLEDMVVSRYLHPDNRSSRIINEWAEAVDSAVSGANEAAWTR